MLFFSPYFLLLPTPFSQYHHYLAGECVRCIFSTGLQPSMKTIKHLQGTQPKPPALGSLLPSVPPFLRGVLSSAGFPSSSHLLPWIRPLLRPLPALPFTFVTFLSFVTLRAIEVNDEANRLRVGRGITLAGACWNIRCAALGRSGCHVYPSVRSTAWEGPAAKGCQ